MGYNIHEHKYYYTFDNSCYYQTFNCYDLYTKSYGSSGLSLERCAIIMRCTLNPVAIVLIIPGHSRREVPRQGCGHS